jgi:pimeloyl-ACP methyl ester carboxylesterase
MTVTRTTFGIPQGTIDVLIGGSGPTITILPRDTGRVGWGVLHERLATRMRVIAPSLPGFDETVRPDWLRSVPDLAAIVGLALDGLDATPGAVMGLGFGGWVAAELAARSPERVNQLVLHSAMGLKPETGDIVDQFLISAGAYVEMGFTSAEAFTAAYDLDDELVARWDNNREMTTRLAWKPYMYDPALPYLLACVRAPALVAWSAHDRIVPASCASLYTAALPDARSVKLAQGGHCAELEAPDALADIVLAHLETTGYLVPSQPLAATTFS